MNAPALSMVSIERQDRIAIVRFDRGNKANPMSIELLRQLTQAARSFENDATVSAVILTGRADNFSMGADLKDEESARARQLQTLIHPTHLGQAMKALVQAR